jgi:eukaryotic-like serine/threonine-protein kinase
MSSQDDLLPQQNQTDMSMQQSGSINLGAWNNVDVTGDVVGGDKVAGDKVLGDKIIYYQTPTSPAPPDPNRRAMLQKVRLIWIEGLLERSIDREARMELSLYERPDAVMFPLQTKVQELNRPPQPVRYGTPIVDIFDKAVGALLILGAAGAGKTTLLLELTSDLIDRAMEHDSHPIPVVYNLSSWAAKRLPLAEWLAEELQSNYGVPLKLSHTWVASDALLPLLDGLDEVVWEDRVACVEAINAYRADHGLAPLAVCSRFDDYGAIGVKLHLNSAIMVEPPTEAQVDAYLAGAGAPLTELRAALREDTVLRDLASTPLLISIMMRAYQDALIETQPSTTLPEERRRHLFNVYVERMLTRHGTEPRYPRERTLRWLAWLARQMIARQQTIFLLEQLDPRLLASQGSWLLYHVAVRFTGSLIFVAACTLAGVAAGSVSPISTPQDGLLLGLAIGSVIAVALAAASVLALWTHKTVAVFIVVVITAVLALLVAPSPNDAVLTALILGLPSALAGVSLVGSATTPPIDAIIWTWPTIRFGLGVGLTAALVLAVVIALLANATAGVTLGLLIGACALLPAILFVMAKREAISASVRPNQAIHRSVGLAVMMFGLVSTIGILIGTAWGIMYQNSIGKGLAFGLILGVPMALVAAFAAGGAIGIRHYLLRAILAGSGVTPWRYRRFLDYTTERVFLRRIGGSYIFYHRLLMEYFASSKEVIHDRE